MSLSKYVALSKEILDEDSSDVLQKNNLEFIKTAGYGKFGLVILCENQKQNQNQEAIYSKVAVKIVAKKFLNESFIIENDILQKLNHKYIVKVIKKIETNKAVYIVMEYLEGGDLRTYMRDKQLEESEIADIMKKLLQAVNYMHENQVIHRDLKPENIIVIQNSLKIIDFGLSVQYLDSLTFYHSVCGTLTYMAPEMLLHKHYSKPIDLYAVGIIFYELVNQNHPATNNKKLDRKLYENVIENNINIKGNFNDIQYDFYQKLVNNSFCERVTAGAALQHPFITRQLNQQIPLTFLQKRMISFTNLKLKKLFTKILIIKFLAKKVKAKKNSLKQFQEDKNLKTIKIKRVKCYSDKLSQNTDESERKKKPSILNSSNSYQTTKPKRKHFIKSADQKIIKSVDNLGRSRIFQTCKFNKLKITNKNLPPLHPNTNTPRLKK